MPGLHTPETDALFEMILQLKSTEECYALFEDLCTVKEVRDMSQRWPVAHALYTGRTYQDAAAATGVSSATISRVSRCLHYGAGGYRTLLARMKGEEDGNP